MSAGVIDERTIHRHRAAWHLVMAGGIRPHEDRVLVRPDPREHRLESGLWLPETAEDETRAQTGTVLAAGPGRRSGTGARIPLDVAAGDRVLYRQWGGTEVMLDGEDLLILWPRDVFALLADDDVHD